MKVLITGASGFVGSSLVKSLASTGADITALSRSALSAERLQDISLTQVTADITKPETLKGLFQGIDYVIHAAGKLGEYGFSEEDYMRLHVDGTRNVLNEVSQVDPQPKILFISSPGVLGPIEGGAADENSPLAPSNPYERSKAAAENLVCEFASTGLPVVIARPEFIYGPGDTHVLGLFRTIQQGRFFYVGDGLNTCHPTYINDAVDGMLRCLKSGSSGEIYHITGPRPVTFRELAETIAAALKVPPPRWKLPRGLVMAGAAGLETLAKVTKIKPSLSRTGAAFFSEDRRFSWAKAESELNYHPQVDLQEGVELTVSWYRQNGYLS